MTIFISVFLLIFGILIFRPFGNEYSNTRNIRLLYISIYIFTCIILTIIYYVFNIQKLLTSQSDNTTINQIILDKNDINTYNIKIYSMSEYDEKTKEEIYAVRKYLVQKNSHFVNKNYSPNEEIMNIDENALWWGTKGIICKGPGRNANAGLSKESAYANNPLVLIDFGIDKAITESADGSSECKDTLPLPSSLTIQPSKKTFTVRYNVSEFLKQTEGSHFHNIIDNYNVPLFAFGYINARDFGYSYAYPEEIKNIVFKSRRNSERNNNNKEVFELNSYWCVGNSCRLSEGCNNICNPSQPFYIRKFPAYAKFKLFKSYPFSHNTTPDLWFEIYLD